MKKSTMFQSFLQSILSEEEVMKTAQLVGYHETARKFSLYTLLQYWTQAARCLPRCQWSATERDRDSWLPP